MDFAKLRQVDPWGEERDDLRFALMTMSIVQAIVGVGNLVQNIATKKNRKPKKFSIDNFHLGSLLGFKKVKKQTQQQMLNIVKLIAGATKAKVLMPGEGNNPNLDPYGGPAIKPHDPNYKG